LQLKACGVDKSEEKQMVLTILSKLGPKLFVFVSTFHSVKFASRATWNMPSLEEFIESLTRANEAHQHEKNQRCMHLLCKMAAINIRNIKINTKGKLMHIQRRKGTQNPSPMPSDPKVEREENERNASTSIQVSIQNLHA
jgi:hypothetical protein